MQRVVDTDAVPGMNTPCPGGESVSSMRDVVCKLVVGVDVVDVGGPQARASREHLEMGGHDVATRLMEVAKRVDEGLGKRYGRSTYLKLQSPEEAFAGSLQAEDLDDDTWQNQV